MDKHLEVQHKQWVRSRQEFGECIEYCELLRSEQPPAVDRALKLALVVTYMRPFTSEPKLSTKKLRYNDGAKAVHRRLDDLRDRAKAHSGDLVETTANVKGVAGPDGVAASENVTAVSRWSISDFGVSEIEAICRHARKVCDERITELAALRGADPTDPVRNMVFTKSTLGMGLAVFGEVHDFEELPPSS